MKITKTVAAAGVAGVVGLAGLGIAALNSPLAVAAPTAEETTAPTAGERLQAIKDALAGLVDDGTITQDQADKVATTLDQSDALRHRGPGGPGGFHGPLDFDAAAKVLGLTATELRTALSAEGTTLADVAKKEGVKVSTLVDALVSAAKDRIAQAVTDGRLTKAQATELTAALPDRIAAAVNEEFRGGRGHGPGRGGPPPTEDNGGATGTPTPGSSTTAGTALNT